MDNRLKTKDFLYACDKYRRNWVIRTAFKLLGTLHKELVAVFSFILTLVAYIAFNEKHIRIGMFICAVIFSFFGILLIFKFIADVLEDVRINRICRYLKITFEEYKEYETLLL